VDDVELDEVDLHGLAPERALRKLLQDLHAARVRRRREVLVITGRGMGNRLQQPLLRTQVEAWLRGPDGVRAGVVSFTQEHRGGALLVRLHGDAPRSGPRARA
jgi:DNA-nicking Smr family endonuclease